MTRKGFVRLKKHVLIPDTYSHLAQFNSERARGIVHNSGWVEAMRLQQQAFDEWQKSLEPDTIVIGREERF